MKLTADATLVEIALVVGATLLKHGVEAVLTGGACVAVYTDGTYTSKDVDFVVLNRIGQATLDSAMDSLGFHREHDRYVHSDFDYYVEFPPPPLSVGSEYNLTPVRLNGPGGQLLALSATDICKDRLAAYAHWSDRQSLKLAIQIALMNEVDRADIRRWARNEGMEKEIAEFLARVDRQA